MVAITVADRLGLSQKHISGLAYDLEILLLGYIFQKLRIKLQQNINNPKSSSTDKWINKKE